jgi:hypothetical protein
VAGAAQTPNQTYDSAIRLVEQSLQDAAQAQWQGHYPDLHRPRRALIELRRGVPNDRLDPVGQVVRDLLTAYAAALEELGTRNAYERDAALSEQLRSELERLRPRAARHGLAVLRDDLRGFAVTGVRPAAPRAASRPAPAATAGDAAGPAPPAAAANAPRRRRRRRSRVRR